MTNAQSRRQLAEDRLRDTQHQLDEAGEDHGPLTEQLAAQRRQRERWSDEVDLQTQQLQRLAQLRIVWNHRFALATAERNADQKTSLTDVAAWHKEAQTALDELAIQFRSRIQRMTDLRNDLATVADKAEAAKDSPPDVINAINDQRFQLEEMLRNQQTSLMQIESTRRVYAKLLDELGNNPLSPTNLAVGALAQVNNVWNTELFHVGEGESKRPIVVKDAVAGLVVFFVGWILSRFFSRVFANRFLKRFRLSKDADAALRSMVYYSMLLVVVLIALNTIKVPLTAFTILGGAFAIGIGFGSQTLINNFIGGLIMLAERPIRLGERIAVANIDGTVEEVGFRSTKIRTLTDHLVTVPNSTLVNEAIENIARRRTIRRLFNVTITYDTPQEKVAEAVQAIREILDEKGIRERIHPIVGFEQFPPRVYFNDYNAESLNILVVYWYAPPEWWDYMDHCERVNFRIMEEFERIGVEFAFPTKTLFLAGDPKRELAVRMVPAETSSSLKKHRNSA